MPDFEPNPDAPETVWAGEYDAQAIADATGASWAAPIFAIGQPRVVNIADLCSAAPPSAPVFTTTDLVQAMNPFADNTALRLKLQNYVDNGLHRTWCTAVDVPPLDPMPTNPPPSDLPSGPPPVGSEDKVIKDIWRWAHFIAREMIPRDQMTGTGQMVTGQGFITFDTEDGGEWEVNPAGVRAQVTEKPDYVGRSNGGAFPVYYDLGWFSLADDVGAQPPLRLQHEKMEVYGSIRTVQGLYYNLAPGVTCWFWPLYPATPMPAGEGF